MLYVFVFADSGRGELDSYFKRGGLGGSLSAKIKNTTGINAKRSRRPLSKGWGSAENIEESNRKTPSPRNTPSSTPGTSPRNERKGSVSIQKSCFAFTCFKHTFCEFTFFIHKKRCFIFQLV